MYVTQAPTATVYQSFSDVWYAVASFVPNILLAVIVVVIGWIVGAILSTVIQQLVKMLQIDEMLQKIGVDKPVKEAGLNLHVGVFLGEVVKWFFIIVFLVGALQYLGLTQVNAFLQGVVLAYLPLVVGAVLILVIGALIAELVKNVITGSARMAGAPSAGFIGSVAKWSIWIVAVMAALTQLGIAPTFLQTLFAGIVVALALAFGLSFGLGGRDAAADYIARARREIGDK